MEKQIMKDGLQSLNRYYSIYQGFIEDNNDPEHLARVKVRVPIISDEMLDVWCYPMGMPSGNGIGIYLMPNVGDVVWVQFVEGDSKMPVWSYGWWGKGDAMEDVEKKGPKISVWQTTSGAKILIDDEEGNIRIVSKSGRTIDVGENISLSKPSKSDEPAVLGNKNADLLKKIIGELTANATNLDAYSKAQITATSSLPILSPLAAGYSLLTGLVAQQKVLLKTLEKMVDLTLSKVVTLD